LTFSTFSIAFALPFPRQDTRLPGPFLVAALAGDVGRARIDGVLQSFDRSLQREDDILYGPGFDQGI